MKFTLTSNTPANLLDLITNAGYLVKNRPVDSNVIVRISHTITAGTKVYYEWCGTELSPWVYVDSTESNFLDEWDSKEFSIEYLRLNSFWLLACCSDTDIYVTLI